MSKVHGKRYAYKFDFQALLQQSCQQAAVATSALADKVTVTSLPDYASATAKFNCSFFNPTATGSSVGGGCPVNVNPNHPYFHHHHHHFNPHPSHHWPVYLNNR